MTLPKLEGKIEHTPRRITGCFSLDYALGDPRKGQYGFPLRAVYEIYGRPERGKNTLAFFMAGAVRAEGRIIYTWLESADPDYVLSAVAQSGFMGTVKMIDHYKEGADPEKDPPKSHEEMCKEAALLLNLPDSNAYILDSIGTTRSRQEQIGDYGDANWGRRAYFINQHMRELEGIVMDKPGQPCIAIALNHVQQDMQTIGGRITYHTPGGTNKEFTAVARIHLKTVDPKSVLALDSITVSRGVVDKLRFGGKGREFLIAIVPGLGLSRGLTALLDCYTLGLVKKETGGLIVHSDGRGKKASKLVIGKVSALVQAAYDNDPAPFGPLYDLLEPLYGQPGGQVETHSTDEE